MILLQRAHIDSTRIDNGVDNAFGGHLEGGGCRGDGQAELYGEGAHLRAIVAEVGDVHNPADFLLDNQVAQVGAACGEAEDCVGLDAVGVEQLACARCGVELEVVLSKLL